MTINSFSSVSLHPPLVAWCIDRAAASCALFCQANRFCLSLLGEQQAELARLFARRGADKFAEIEPSGPGIAPRIPGCCVWFECRHYRSLPAGDHRLIIAEVTAFEANGQRPLLFAGGQFTRLPGPAAVAA
jgi:flavin reductase (DIM6/NTAB) family NADH-FMN oxidoreductase RutF